MINPKETVSFKDGSGESFLRYTVPEWSRRNPEKTVLEICLCCGKLFEDSETKFAVFENYEYNPTYLNVHATLSKKIGSVCVECLLKFQIFTRNNEVCK